MNSRLQLSVIQRTAAVCMALALPYLIRLVEGGIEYKLAHRTTCALLLLTCSQGDELNRLYREQLGL